MPRLRPLASMTELTVKPSGILCRKIARKISHPSQFDTRNPDAMAMPSKNVWMISPSSTEYPVCAVDEFVVVRFFAEVKMRGNRVLEEVDDQIAEQNQQGRSSSAQFETLRNHLHQGRGQHESRAQRDEVAKIAPLPMPLHDDRAAEDVGGGGGQAQENAGVIGCMFSGK